MTTLSAVLERCPYRDPEVSGCSHPGNASPFCDLAACPLGRTEGITEELCTLGDQCRSTVSRFAELVGVWGSDAEVTTT
jgi:hypothetical protein